MYDHSYWAYELSQKLIDSHFFLQYTVEKVANENTAGANHPHAITAGLWGDFWTAHSACRHAAPRIM